MAIVLAADFSAPAAYARDAAVALARRLGESLVVVHAVEPYEAEPANRAAHVADVRRRLGALAAGVRAAGVAAEVALLDGIADEAIAEYARRIDAALVVMGTHARHAPLRWLVGGVAERTMRGADVPVLAVRRPPDALARWADEGSPLRVLVGIESAAIASPLLAVIERLRAAGPCDTTFAHASAGATATPPLRARLDAALRARLARLAGTGAVEVRLLGDGDPLAELAAVAREGRPYGLVVVGVHLREGLGVVHGAAVATGLVHHGVDPLLAVPLGRASSARGEPVARVRSVLAATDLSPRGNRAAAFAHAFVRDGGAVTLCYVHDTRDGEEALADVVRADIELELLSLVPRDDRGITTDVLLVEAPDVAGAIVDSAADLGVDAICLGASGRGALARAVLGSVAHAVLHRAPRPVVLVP